MSAKFVHLTTAPDQITAEIWLSILQNEGIAAMILPSDSISFLGVSAFGCRMQVREDQLEQARDVLGEEAIFD